jgi:hypothetical protein
MLYYNVIIFRSFHLYPTTKEAHMPEGNVIKVSFGKPRPPKSLENEVAICDRAEPSSPADFSSFFECKRHGLLNRSKLISMFVKQHLFNIGLEFQEKADYQWLKDHSEHIERFLSKIKRIETQEDGRKWTVARDKRAIVKFPPEFPGKIRIFLFVEEEDSKEYEVLREGAGGVVLVSDA